MKVSKWHGLGNDYLVIEEAALPEPLTTEAIALLCDRHRGVGSDGILLKGRPSGAVPGAVVRMRVFNPDGSESEMCGNGIRIFARYLAGIGETPADEFIVETLAGPIRPRLLADGQVRVDMGRARFRSANIDLSGVREHAVHGVVDAELMVHARRFRFTFVDVGNPHCVIQVTDPATFEVADVGKAVEHHPFFSHRTNVEFIRVEPDGSVRMRVWERGVGETQACGTGATAVGAACVRLGLTESPVTVHLPGGDLLIEVGGLEGGDDADAGGAETGAGGADTGAAEGLPVSMTGPAEEVFTAELAPELLLRLGRPAPHDRT